MNISIIGCGYVGIVTGICLANSGHKIHFFDNDQKKLKRFKEGKNIIYEKDLKKRYSLAKKKKNIFFCKTLYEAIHHSQACFVCVGTPFSNGNIDLKYIKEVTSQIAKIVDKKKLTIIYKSTIPPETVEKFCLPLYNKKLKNQIDKNINIVFNPEFLREGSAIYDFENPERIIIGIRNLVSKKIMIKLYSKYIKKSKIIFLDIKTAEFIKYFSNSFFSLLISFSNELSNLSKKLNIDFIDVLNAFKLDNRFKSKNKSLPEFINYLKPGIGYGGSCFPKDVKTFIKFAKKNNLSILDKVDKINSKQPYLIAKSIIKEFKKRKVRNCLILGITFKENTDDIRNSTSIDLANYVAKDKFKVSVYDP